MIRPARRRATRVGFLVAAMAAVLGLSGCAVAEPTADQVVLHYSGGPFSSQAWQSCVPAGQRSVEGASDILYYYPDGQRTYNFSGDPAADGPAISVSTKDQVVLGASGTIAFHLNTDCSPWTDPKTGREWPGGKFQAFNDRLGRAAGAFATEGGAPQPEGWRAMLRLYLGQAADRAMDQAGLGYGWVELSSNQGASDRWIADVENRIQTLINEQMGGDFFIVDNLQVGRPVPPEGLQTELNNRQGAVIREQSLEIDKRAAAGFPGGVAGYQSYQQQQAINEAIKGGRVQVLPVPQGSSIIVDPRTGG